MTREEAIKFFEDMKACTYGSNEAINMAIKALEQEPIKMVAIKGMSMPSCCHWDCPLCNEDGDECMLGSYDTKTDTTKKRACDCPLVEIEERKAESEG